MPQRGIRGDKVQQKEPHVQILGCMSRHEDSEELSNSAQSER